MRVRLETYYLHNQTYNNKERRNRSVARNFKTAVLVLCSSSNAHKISVNQTGFTQFQGVFGKIPSKIYITNDPRNKTIVETVGNRKYMFKAQLIVGWRVEYRVNQRKKKNGSGNDFMINLHGSYVTELGLELATLDSAIQRALKCNGTLWSPD